jgi:hypothetical protein
VSPSRARSLSARIIQIRFARFTFQFNAQMWLILAHFDILRAHSQVGLVFPGQQPLIEGQMAMPHAQCLLDRLVHVYSYLAICNHAAVMVTICIRMACVNHCLITHISEPYIFHVTIFARVISTCSISFIFDRIRNQLSRRLKRVQPEVSRLKDRLLLELDVSSVEPIPKVEPAVASVKSETNISIVNISQTIDYLFT